ncbi:MAG: NAD(P)H-binding protein [Kocuria sp.]|nr:NAD(P)H-binding protein [Kocuria sp.]
MRELSVSGVKSLIFVLSLGIYHELPEPFETWNDQMIGDALKDYRRAADIIEASDLDYTILRPAWLTDADEIDFEITQRDEQFKGTEISRKSVGAFVTDIVADPSTHARTNVGLNKPDTDGDKPSFY